MTRNVAGGGNNVKYVIMQECGLFLSNASLGKFFLRGMWNSGKLK